MKTMCLAILVGLAQLVSAQTGAEEKRMRTETNFELTVHAPYAETAKLFGPEGERVWAGKHWDPKFIHPQPGRDEEGAVFTNQHGQLNAVWVIAQHDLDARHFRYVYFMSDLLVTTIDVRFRLIDASDTKVSVSYTRTAVTPAGDEHVAALTRGDESAGKDWQHAIDQYLESRNSAAATH